jgi:hypothetical protein
MLAVVQYLQPAAERIHAERHRRWHGPHSGAHTVLIIIMIIIITCVSCLEARYVCRQAAVKAAKILPLVGLARSKCPD